MVVFNASNTQFLHLSTRHNLPHNYDIFFENTQLKSSSLLNKLCVAFSRNLSFENTQPKPSSVLNILGVSFSCDLSWKDHIISLSKQASKRLGVLRCVRGFFTPPQLLS